MAYEREVDEKERKHLAEIGRSGGKSRSTKKLQAVTQNLIFAMRARFPKDPKWNPALRSRKTGKKSAKASKASKVLKSAKAAKSSKSSPVKAVRFGRKRFAPKFVPTKNPLAKKGGKNTQKVMTQDTKSPQLPVCFLCQKEISPSQLTVSKRHPTKHRPVMVHVECPPARSQSSE